MAAKKKYRRMGKIPTTIAGAVMVAALVCALFMIYGAGPSSIFFSRASSAPARAARADAKKLSATLDPNLFTGEARRAYQVAGHHPALLAQMHCYCGCERDGMMHNLLDCYRTDHGSQCPVCIGEALEAERLAKQGVPIERIRDKLRARWANGE